jgi:hypothetical protein
METRPMTTTNGTNAQAMPAMAAGAPAARPVSGVGSFAYRWHVISCFHGAKVFTDTTKLPARRLSEAPL